MSPFNPVTGLNMPWISLAITILRGVLTQPLVQKTLDNFTQGTSNQIDDMVWAAVKRALDLKITPALATSALKDSLKSIQRVYDSMSPEQKWEAKKPRLAWTSDEAGRFTFNA